MTAPYTTQTVTGYNSGAPADDGSQVSTNEIKWSNHKTKLGDPLKTAIEAIDTELLSAFGLVFGQEISTHATDYTVVAGDQGKFLSVTGTTTITLLAAATAGANFPLAIINNGTGVVTVDGSGAETINGSATISLTPNGYAILTCNGTLWVGIVKSKPSFSVHKNGTAQTNITGYDKVTWSTEEFDTNSNFDNSTNYRFTPTVGGKYNLSATIEFSSAVDADNIYIGLYKNGTIYKEVTKNTINTVEAVSLNAVVDANGTTDYFEIYAKNDQRDTSSISGASESTFWTGCKID